MTLRSIAGALLASVILCANQPAFADWKDGNPKDIRIVLRHPDMMGKYTIKVRIDESKGISSAQADILVYGNIKDENSPFLVTLYQSSSRFYYSRLKEIMSRFGDFEGVNIDYIGDVKETSSSISDVEYVLFRQDNPKLGIKRSCGFWAGFSGGNRYLFEGYVCPPNREATDDDVKKAVNAIVLKNQQQ